MFGQKENVRRKYFRRDGLSRCHEITYPPVLSGPGDKLLLSKTIPPLVINLQVQYMVQLEMRVIGKAIP